ncbi:hypothetical protein E3N88_09695 [Mikania micrantha]|uniref:Uncharacterized protein n=1 Tax=Mikania micrantha TaxID=192012 RepID=A0A5N6PJR8_9ASTR|nr:hypothetical protein E3N88_09695 [Mikania micrantha]
MVVPAKGVTVPVKQDKVWFAESKGQKKVYVASVKPRAMVVQAERGRRFKPVRGFGNSGSTGRVSGPVPKLQWVLKTRTPTDKISLVDYLLNLESVVVPWCISGSGGMCKLGGMCKPVEIEDGSVMVTLTNESVMTNVLKLSEASTILSELLEDWITVCLDGGLDLIARPPSGRLLGFGDLLGGS